MSQTADNDFLVVKFVKLPQVFGNFCYRCIHRSWIVTGNGRNVFIAILQQAVESLRTNPINVSDVYSATLEYRTDDFDDGLRFVCEKLAEHMRTNLSTQCNDATSKLCHLLKVLPPKQL